MKIMLGIYTVGWIPPNISTGKRVDGVYDVI